MSDPARSKAIDMLAALRADRFKEFAEGDFVALGIPYELRRETKNVMLRERAKRPYDEWLTPRMTPKAYTYQEMVESGKRLTRTSWNWICKYKSRYMPFLQRAADEANGRLGHLDKPLAAVEREAVRLYWHHWGQIDHWHEVAQRNWDLLSETERLWFRLKPSRTYSAFDFPLDAPAKYAFYPTEETPERLRQMQLLEWVIHECGSEPGL